MAEDQAWGQDVLQQLKRRNQENASVRNLVSKYNVAVETERNYSQQNLKLERVAEKLEQELLELKKGGASLTSSSLTVEQLSETYNKRLKQEEEIKELKERMKERLEQAKALERVIATKDDEITKLGDEKAENIFTISVLNSELMELQIQLVTYGKQVDKQTQDNATLAEKLVAPAKAQAAQIETAKKFLTQSDPTKAPPAAAGGQPPTRTLSGAGPAGAQKARAATGIGGTAILPGKNPSIHLQSGTSDCSSIAFSPTGSCFATAGTDRIIRVWDSITARSKTTLTGPERAINAVAFSTNDEYLLAASNDNSTRIWSIQTGRVIHNLMGHLNKVISGVFTLDSNKVITGSHDRTIRNWDLSRGICIRSIMCDNSCNDLCVTRDGNMVVSGHLDSSVRFWDNRNGELIHTSKVHTAKISGITLSSGTPPSRSLIGWLLSHSFPVLSVFADILLDGTTVLSNSRDHTLRAFDLRKEYAVVHTYKHDDYCNGSDWARSCYSSDNRYVVAGGNDGAVFIWDAKTAALEKKLVKGHTAPVLCVSWNPNGTQLVSSDKSGNVQIWTSQ